MLGRLTGVGRISVARLVSVAICLAGVACVSLGMGGGAMGTTNAWLGNLSSSLSAFLYSCYLTFLKRYVQNRHDQRNVNMVQFFGFVGVLNVLLLWPFFLVLNATGLEPFELPQKPSTRLFLLINALVGTCLSEFLFCISMLLTSPLSVTLGMAMTIPLSLVGDVILKGLRMTWLYVIGALLVFCGFVGVNLASILQSWDDAIDAWCWSLLSDVKSPSTPPAARDKIPLNEDVIEP